MKKRILIPTLILGTLLTGSLALASPGFDRGNCGNCPNKGQAPFSYEQHEERMEQRLEMMSTVLDLSENQQEQIATLLNQRWQNRQQHREQMQAARDAMREARSTATFDEADFRAKAAKQAELKTDMMVERAKMKAEIYALLTPEQQEKAEKLGGMLDGPRQGHHGQGRHGGHGFRF